MNAFFDTLFFGIYPYVALVVFLLGSLVRFEREQYSWKSDSSQLLRHGQLQLGSNLFHVGILGIFFGHLVGLLTPLAIWHALGVTAAAKQIAAIVAGGAFGAMLLVGVVLLLYRRFAEPRIRATTRVMDWAVLWLLGAQVALGLATLPISMSHLDGAEMVKLMTWAQHIATFQGDAAGYVAQTPLLFKAHLALGLTLFVVFPFSRLVHVWSGFASISYLARAYQLVRAR